MSTDTTSIFYKIGTSTKSFVTTAINNLLANNNTWTGTNTFHEDVTVGKTGSGNAKVFKVFGTAESTSDLTVGGNLTVNGTTTTLSTANLDVQDNFIRLSQGASAGAFDKDQGFYFERAQGSDAASLVWDESADSFVLGTVPSGTAAYLEEAYSTSGDSIAFTKDAYNNVTAIVYTPDSSNTVISGFPVITFEAPTGATFTITSIKGNFSTDGYEFAENTTDASNGDFHTLTVSEDSDDLDQINFTEKGGGSDQLIVDYTYHAAVAGGDSTSDTVSATPGAVNVGSLKVGSDALGNLADFTAGLTT